MENSTIIREYIQNNHGTDNFRILVADDEYEYLDLFRQALSLITGIMSFELVSCDHADDAVYSVKKSIEQNRPFAVAFLDIRMPSGHDGLWAARQIREMDPHIEIVIISGYSDYTPQEIVSYIPPVHKLIYMQKPFRLYEIHHFAHALSTKWLQELNWLTIHENMERLVKERTKELSAANERLEREAFKHQQTAATLKESEEKYRELFTNESDAVMIFDAETNRFEDANPAALALFGYSKEEFVQLAIQDISTEKGEAKIDIEKITGNDSRSGFSPRRQFQKKDGGVFPGEIYAGIFLSNGRKKVIGAVRDITERLITEEKLRYLSVSLLTAQEKERKQIAMELHDDFGQTLSVLKLNLRNIMSRLSRDQKKLKNECENSILYVNQVLEKVRRLSHGLTPSTLDDLGLTVALKGLIRDFSMNSGITFSCKLKGIDKLFSSMAQLIIYRVFQEALTNIHSHSGADRVSITARKGKRDVSFAIEDNGEGFDTQQVETRAPYMSGLGLTSMRERVRMLGGHLEIESRLSKGTRIAFAIPFMK